MSEDGAGPAHAYARQVGERLRVIRRQKGLSLHDVESFSDDEFKASVVGAYERGERAISVPRLQRLAGLYRVPVDQLLPSDGVDRPDEGDGARGGPGAAPEGVSFDLARFAHVDDPQLAMVRRYLDRIAVRRQDFNGRVLTIRADDFRALAYFLLTTPEELCGRLTGLGLAALPA